MNTLKIKKLLKKSFKYLGYTLGSLTFFLFFVFTCLRIGFIENSIKDFAVEKINSIISANNLELSINNLELNLPFSVRVENVQVKDEEGEFASLESLTINSRFLALLRYRVVIPSIDFVQLAVSRLPKITMPEEQTAPKKQSFEELFNQVHEVLFNGNLPSIYVSKISLTHATINPAILHSFKKSEQSEQMVKSESSFETNATTQKILDNYFVKPLVVDAVWSCGLEKEILRFSGEINLSSQEKQATLKNTIDILASKNIRFGLDFIDNKGLSFAIIKEILGYAQTEDSFAKFSLHAVGTPTIYEIKSTGSVFDKVFLYEPANLQGFYSSKPFKGNLQISAKPIIPNIIKKGTLLVQADLDTRSITDSGEFLDDKAVTADKSKENTSSASTTKKQADISNSASSQAEKKEVPSKNVGINYAITFDNVEYIPENLQKLLGTKQEIKGLINVQFFTRQLPKFLAKDIVFTGKNINSTTNISISRDINIKSDFAIKSFSFLNTDTQKYKGTLKGALKVSGKLENPRLELKTNIPEFTLTTYKSKQDKDDNNNGNFVYAQNISLFLKTLGFEKKEDVIPLDIEKLKALYQKNPYSAAVKRMQELHHSAVNYPVKMQLSIQAKYMDKDGFLRSNIRLSPRVLGLGEHKENFVEFNSISGEFLGATLSGAVRLDIPFSAEDLAKEKSSNDKLDDSANKAMLLQYPIISGAISGSLDSANEIATAFAIPLQIENLTYNLRFSDKKHSKQNIFLQATAQKGTYNENVWNTFNARLHFQDIYGTGSTDSVISFDDIELNDIGKVTNWKITLKGLFSKMAFAFGFGGDASFNTKAEISTNFEQIAIKLQKFDFVYPYKKTNISLKKMAELYISRQNINVKNLRLLVAPKGEAFLEGQLSQQNINISGWLKDIDLNFLPKDLRGLVDGRFSITGSSQKPKGSLEARLRDFRTLSSPKVSLVVKGKIIEIQNEHRASFELKMIDKEKYDVKDAYLTLQIPLEYAPFLRLSKTKAIIGKVLYTGSLKTLWGYVPLAGRKLTGDLSLLGAISGSLSRPNVTLSAKASDARYEDLIAGILLSNLNFALDFKKGHGDITVSAKDGRKGDFSLTGTFDVPFLYHGKYKPVFEKTKDTIINLRRQREIMRSMAVLDLATHFTNFNPFYRNDFTANLTGNLTIKEHVEAVKIVGDIVVNKADVHLQNIRTSSIPSLNIVADSSKRIRKNKAGTKGNLAINISIPRNLGVFGPGLETFWKGDLFVGGRAQNPFVKGVLVAWKGKMNLLGSELNLSKGEVSFDGSTPIVPALNLVLEHKSAGVQSFIVLKGMALKPELEMTSNPYLPSDEVLARILFSRSVSELSDFEKIRLATVLTSLVGFNFNTGITDSTKNILGLDVLEVNSKESANGEEDISVEIGKYLKNNVYIGIEQGVGQQETSGVFKYEINENFSVGTKAGTEDSEVGFRWKFDY